MPAKIGDLILIRVLPIGSFPRMTPATCANDAPLQTVGNGSGPMACGPNVDHRPPQQARLITSRGAGCRSSVADQEIPAFVWVVMTRFAAPAMRRSSWVSYDGCSEAASSSPTDPLPGTRNNRPPGCAMA